MKKSFLLFIIALIAAVLFTLILGLYNLHVNTIKEAQRYDSVLEQGGFPEFISIGGFPLPFMCRGLCPWRFNVFNFAVDVFLTILIILLAVFIGGFYYKKLKNKRKE